MTTFIFSNLQRYARPWIKSGLCLRTFDCNNIFKIGFPNNGLIHRRYFYMEIPPKANFICRANWVSEKYKHTTKPLGFFLLTWIALAFLEDVFKSRLEETVAHFVSVSVGSREIFEGDLFLGIAVPFLGCESAHRVSRGGYQSWSHSYLVLCPRCDVKPSLPVLMKTHHLVLLGI